MSVDAKPMTWRQLAELPDDGIRRELIRGELVVMAPPAGTEHGGFAGNVHGYLFQHVKRNKLGGVVLSAETGVRLEDEPDTVRGSDVSYISPARWPKGGVEGYFAGAPDFVVEVLSKNDRVAETDDKIDLWLAAGARLVWLVNPRRKSVTVYRPNQPPALFVEPHVLDAGDVVPGFTLPVADIFVLD